EGRAAAVDGNHRQPSGKVVLFLLVQHVILLRAAGGSVPHHVGWCEEIAPDNSAAASVDVGHGDAVGLRPVPVGVGLRRVVEADRTGVVQEGRGVNGACVELEREDQMVSGVTPVVDVNLVGDVVPKAIEVGAACRVFERYIVGDDNGPVG